MKLNLTAEQQAQLLRYLTNDPDCEQLTEREFVADLYDVEKPATFNILIDPKDGVEIVAAAELLYSESEDGWYMGNHIESEAEIVALLTESGALS